MTGGSLNADRSLVKTEPQISLLIMKLSTLEQSLCKNQNICYAGFHERPWIETCRPRKLRGLASFQQIDAVSLSGRGARKDLPPLVARNPLKSHVSDERIQGNPSKSKPPIQEKPSEPAPNPVEAKRFQIAGSRTTVLLRLTEPALDGHFQASNAFASIASPSEDFWKTSLAMRLSSSSNG